MAHRHNLLSPATFRSTDGLFNTSSALPGKHTTESIAVVSATILCLGLATGAVAQASDLSGNQAALSEKGITAHDWHTGEPKKLVFKGKNVSMENPGGDPDFLVDGDTIYVYTSTDANQREYIDTTAMDSDGNGVLDDTYLNMDGYTVWSSTDMTHWTNHGVQFAAANMDIDKWRQASETSLNMSVNTNLQLDLSPHAMWAPTAAKYTDGTNTTYVLYYPKGIDGTSMFATGYATAPTPVGPFTDQGPIYGDMNGSRFLIGMDPNVFQDDDGKIYIYGNGPTDPNNADSPGKAVVAQLSAFDHTSNTQSLITEPRIIDYDMNNTMYDGLAGNRFPDTDFHEGGSMHKANGKYYFSWAEHYHDHYNGWYSMCSSPMGPCEWMGPTVKGIYYGNQHGSFVQFKGNEYFLSHIDHDAAVKEEQEWDSYRRTWTAYPVTYNTDKSIRVMYPSARTTNINIGGEYVDDNGTTFMDSTYVNPTSGFLEVDDTNLAAFQGANTAVADLELYKAQRVAYGSVPLTISVPVEDDTYTVTLRFAEIDKNAQQNWFERVMDISAEGELVKAGLNVMAEAGHYGAYDETFLVTVSDGYLDIDIVPVAGDAMLSAVKISKPAESGWALNIGGGTETVKGITYGADPGVGDFNDNTAESITLNTKEVFRASQDEEVLFQSTRIGWSGLSYSNTTLDNGNYEVTLGFVETHYNEAGSRIFDVEIEGILVLDNFDIYKAAGGRNVAAKRIFPVKLTDGTLNINLTTVLDASKISFIKVAKTTGEVLDSSIRINAGNEGSDTDTNGAYFLKDNQFLVGTSSGGSSYNPTTRQDLTYTGVQTVVPSDETIYQTERYGANFGYAIPVRNGRYRVRLMFAEQYHTAPGMREFSISLEGSIVPVGADNETTFDIYSRTGGKNKAMDLFYEVDVKDQMLNIDFNKITDNASVTGIVVTPYYLKENEDATTSDLPNWVIGYRDDQL